MRAFARALIGTLFVWAAIPVAQPLVERVWFVYSLANEEPPTALPNPLASRRASRFVDSWGNPRAGGRHHEGIDIFAPKDTPVVSTTSGLVTKVGTNHLGGQVVWILGPGLERHYYAHLSRYGAFRAGDRVEAGAIIGYAGDTGNARGGRCTCTMASTATERRRIRIHVSPLEPDRRRRALPPRRRPDPSHDSN